ncbi:MAG TPA: alginate export family protein [Chitinophagaceae bacterium]|nr:alginate export family protein [Chitinophagaceae bacterium]
MRYFLIYFFLSLPMQLLAQSFKLMRYDENYSRLKDSVRTFYHRIKYIPLSQSGSVYLCFGGEGRQELDYAVNEDWGARGLGRDIFLLQRYHLHADLHLGNRIRFFGQLRSGLEDGRKNGPRPIDEDQLNVHNLFVDVIAYNEIGRTVTLRLGRQEVQYGSGRLIDVNNGPNLRLYFDGAKVAYATSRLKLDAFVLAEAIVYTGIFDNNSTRKANLWGIYSTYTFPKSANFDFYYLGINRESSRFDEGIADEVRHTLGTRFWKNGTGFIYNFEAMYQFGKFGSDNIRALGLSSEIGYLFGNIKGAPAIKLKNDIISGDKRKGDGRLGTPNGLYPNGGYFGMNPQVGPANLISVHPNFTWSTKTKVRLTMDVLFSWRYSTEDGIYGPSGSFRMSGSDSEKRYVGTAYITTLSWNINRFLNYNIGVQYFKTGSFINEAIPQHRNGFFVGSVIGFNF